MRNKKSQGRSKSCLSKFSDVDNNNNNKNSNSIKKFRLKNLNIVI